MGCSSSDYSWTVETHAEQCSKTVVGEASLLRGKVPGSGQRRVDAHALEGSYPGKGSLFRGITQSAPHVVLETSSSELCRLTTGSAICRAGARITDVDTALIDFLGFHCSGVVADGWGNLHPTA